jgi:transcriptional regulator with XRE-family HTH domain
MSCDHAIVPVKLNGVAEAAGIHHTYVGLLERGQRNPTIDVAEKTRGCAQQKALSND